MIRFSELPTENSAFASEDSLEVWASARKIQCHPPSGVDAEQLRRRLILAGVSEASAGRAQNDGRIYPTVCGAPTGDGFCFEINATSLARIPRGFSLWTHLAEVYEFDGTIQCQGNHGRTPVEAAQFLELEKINVFLARKAQKVVPRVCGYPTGAINVLLIAPAHIENAERIGFRLLHHVGMRAPDQDSAEMAAEVSSQAGGDNGVPWPFSSRLPRSFDLGNFSDSALPHRGARNNYRARRRAASLTVELIVTGMHPGSAYSTVLDLAPGLLPDPTGGNDPTSMVLVRTFPTGDIGTDQLTPFEVRISFESRAASVVVLDGGLHVVGVRTGN